MPAYTLTAPALTLGGFLRDRRERLAPEPGAQGRRRTPGLRREEVATRAGVSVTWYTWLEQERGGPPSSEVLERLARALELDDSGREALFLLAQQRAPPLRAVADRPRRRHQGPREQERHVRRRGPDHRGAPAAREEGVHRELEPRRARGRRAVAR